ncbi:hypothetical protein BZK31_13305 [Pseudomonas floridensis]|uniref:DUF6644 domain-containing protein n=1 Tax=Pseudomonas floridensis TaxID=1958950 RepID=A0A1X0N5Z1_9PSED|nr:DUF6644 family protein [Pseudomonas floridensis]ORC58772.1 hypothetical protein BZK31_13305 [Pseudomonas floridensis]
MAAASEGSWLVSIEGSPLGQAMRDQVWLYPAIEVVHILGFAVLVGSVVLFDLRLLGWSKDIPITALARHLLSWALTALLLIVPAGLMMFAAHPNDFASNGVFILKLCLIAAAGVNAMLFHMGVYRSVAHWNTRLATPCLAKCQAVLSIALWIGVVTCGRLLAYT